MSSSASVSSGSADASDDDDSDYSVVERDAEEFNDEEEEEGGNIRDIPEKIVPYLAARAYHIPGNTWWQDWYQFCIANNHEVFGIFLHYKHHPVDQFERLLVLLMSIGASLIVSNFFLLYFLWRDGLEQKTVNATLGDHMLAYEHYRVASFTVGALIVSMFNLSVWYIAACGCFEAGGRFQHLRGATILGTVLLFIMLEIIILVAVLLLLLAGSYQLDESLDTQDIFSAGFAAINTTAAISDFGSKAAKTKLATWVKQVFLSVFVYDFIISTTFFSGIFGCIPVIGRSTALGLGGRAAEIEEAKTGKSGKKKDKKLRNRSSKSTRTSGSISSESS